MMNGREVLELFGRQYGVATTSQLVALGVSARTSAAYASMTGCSFP